MSKEYNAYKTIGEVVKILSTNQQQNKPIKTHTIRFWEKEFKQIKPKILTGKRRYYDIKNVKILKKVHYLLKERGMTIKGVKKILDNNESIKLDETFNQSIKAKSIRDKLIKISNTLKKMKKK